MTTKSCAVLCMLLFFGPFLLCGTEVQDVCDLDIKGSSPRSVSVRGLARRTSDGLVMVDYTCPAAVEGTSRLPTLVLIEEPAFAREADKMVYQDRRKSLSLSRRTLYQMVVRGALTCSPKFQYRTNEQNEYVAGNGYGAYGLIKCSLRGALVSEMYVIE